MAEGPAGGVQPTGATSGGGRVIDAVMSKLDGLKSQLDAVEQRMPPPGGAQPPGAPPGGPGMGAPPPPIPPPDDGELTLQHEGNEVTHGGEAPPGGGGKPAGGLPPPPQGGQVPPMMDSRSDSKGRKDARRKDDDDDDDRRDSKARKDARRKDDDDDDDRRDSKARKDEGDVNEEGHAIGKGDSKSRKADDDDDDDRRDSKRKDAKRKDDDDDDDDRRDSKSRKDSARDDEDETSGGSKNPMKGSGDSRADSIMVPRADWERVTRTIAQLTEHHMMPEENQAKFADAQSRADSVYGAFGKRADRWLPGEDLTAYRKRLATPMRPYSKRWSDTKLSDLQGRAFDNAETDIYNDALVASNDTSSFGEGELRRHVEIDPDTGQRVITYRGRTSFIRGFAAPGRRARINRFGPDGDVIPR